MRDQRAKVNQKVEFIKKCQKEGPDAGGCVSDSLVQVGYEGYIYIKYFYNFKERVFKAYDKNNDGQLTDSEINPSEAKKTQRTKPRTEQSNVGFK